MRKFLVPLVAIAALAGTPALANEGRIEGRGGLVWDGDDSEAVAGAAIGYDWDLGSSAFVGAEFSADKILDGAARVSFGIGGRAGVRLGDANKLYGVAAFQTKPCRGCEESVSAGAGFQHSFTDSLYGKVEYRHFFVGNGFSDYDSAVAGVGVKF